MVGGGGVIDLLKQEFFNVRDPGRVVVDEDLLHHRVPLLGRQLQEHVAAVLDGRVGRRLGRDLQQPARFGRVTTVAGAEVRGGALVRGGLGGDEAEHRAGQGEVVVPHALGPDPQRLPQVFAEVGQVAGDAVLGLDEFNRLPAALEGHVIELLDRHADAGRDAVTT